MGVFTMPGKNQIKTDDPVHIAGYWQLVWKQFRQHKLALIGGVIFLFLILFTVAGPFFVPHKYGDMNFMAIFAPPLTEEHLMGTNELGQDVLVRVMYGGRISLMVGFIAASLSVSIGTTIGLLSGFFGGNVDRILMRLVDVMLSIPMFPVLLTLTLVFGSGLRNVILVLTLFGWMGVARLVRGTVLSLRETEYVMAARALGARNSGIILRHIFPNVLPIIIVSATLNISFAILAESSLSYLGLGIQPPTPSWGNMLQNSLNYMLGTAHGVSPWWLTFFPGFLIFLTVLNINFLGDGLRDALDPKVMKK